MLKYVINGLIAACLAVPSLTAQAQEQCQSSPFTKTEEATKFGSLAEDFSLETNNGTFILSRDWKSCDVHLFYKSFTVPEGHPLKRLSDLANNLWQSRFDYLLQYGPRNAQYFFMSFNADPAQRLKDQAIIQTNLDSALGALSPEEQAYWKQRIHIVTSDPASTAWVAKLGVESFVIDRFQKVQRLGVGIFSPLLKDQDFLKFGPEVEFYNFQWQREKALEARKDDLIVDVFKNEEVAAGWTAFGGKINSVNFPSEAEMGKFDSMLVELEISCNDSRCVYEQGNYYYDRLIEVYLCRDEADTQCDIEVARWVTPFGLGGRWVHDISPLLALVKKGGQQRFRFHTVDRYNVSLKFRLAASHAPTPKPFAYQELFRGGSFATPNSTREPIRFAVPEGTKRVQLVSVTTGHGWGKDKDNCAEFCVSEHEWTLNNGPALIQRLDGPSDQLSCFFATGRGVIPNQPGTWFFGRAGWCPGLEVQPQVWDITHLVNMDASNEINYRSLFNGADYVPVASPDAVAQGYDAEINLRSYLIFSR